MTEQQQAPQPNSETALRVLSEEVHRANDTRLYLLAMLEDTKAEAIAEIAARDSEIAGLKAKVEGLETQLAMPANGRVKKET